MESSIERLCILAWKKARGFVTFHMQHVIFLAEIILLQRYDFLLSLKHESFEAVQSLANVKVRFQRIFISHFIISRTLNVLMVIVLLCKYIKQVLM
jgi:hypothetical protein